MVDRWSLQLFIILTSLISLFDFQDQDQRWKKCIEVLTENLPFAIGNAYVNSFFSAEAKALVMEMFSSIKQQFTALITQAEWIDESSRNKLLSKLKSLVPLMAYPDHGFDERSINELYDEVKLDKSQYLRTLFQLRVVDADNKFRQTYTSTALESSNSWKKFLPPTSVAALYSQSDNTIRKTKLYKPTPPENSCSAVINFDLFPR